ncbi:MAG: bifunctional UDP-N-acetylglucosamine diphosphorylase/glucosamine-1-phosphate N-acetyltransferase GlmU [Chloroflexi bacterium]|nr:bifunctional UDP-N-acetylglucosamine diphosphorylase/glucosamine-1-phosphate N-acetyltransferase GlmU [Chloroflexota bacterium]
MNVSVVILAAGQGVRMRSSLPKVLHPLAGKPMITYTLQATAAICCETPVVVVGHGADEVRSVVGKAARFVVQEQRLGTAHAVLAAESLLAGKTDLVLVTSADMPLLTAETFQELVTAQRRSTGPITMLTVVSPNPRGFGRVVRRQEDGAVLAIVEEAQCTPEQLAIHELNVGAYCFRSDWLWPALHKVGLSPKGEYYLTDLVAIAVEQCQPVQAIPLRDPAESIGVNNRVHLAEAESLLHQRINLRWMLEGVTLVDPQSTYIESEVEIGPDTVIHPNTHLRGKTCIGSHCEIGPNTIIADTEVGNYCTVLASVLEQAILENHVGIGPFGHLRKGAHLAEGVHMGNFGEVKDSFLGRGTKMGHFSYIGNATIGEDVNIGAGTITCNFDGVNKNPTVIGDGAFIGSDTMLVAPVNIGAGAKTGAGSVVTHDVPPQEVAVGVPARLVPKREEEKGE